MARDRTARLTEETISKRFNTGGIYGMPGIVKYTGLSDKTLKYLFVHFGFPLLKLPGPVWYMHRDLFYMWYLSWQRLEVMQTRGVAEHLKADFAKRFDAMRQEMGLIITEEETELLRRIFTRIWGTKQAQEFLGS